MTDTLPLRWRLWRNDRIDELVGTGASRSLATRIATAEARGRSEVAQWAGEDAALAASLVVYEDEEGGLRFYLGIPDVASEAAFRSTALH